VTIPYRHTSGTLSLLEFDNVGNAGTPVTLPIGIPQSVGDPYTTSTGTPVALSTGGANVGSNADDQYDEVLFPRAFTFPFFGTTYDSMTISSNGALYFGAPPPNEITEMPTMCQVLQVNSEATGRLPDSGTIWICEYLQGLMPGFYQVVVTRKSYLSLSGSSL
jgi:hypothetical protein